MFCSFRNLQKSAEISRIFCKFCMHEKVIFLMKVCLKVNLLAYSYIDFTRHMSENSFLKFTSPQKFSKIIKKPRFIESREKLCKFIKLSNNFCMIYEIYMKFTWKNQWIEVMCLSIFIKLSWILYIIFTN